MQASKSGAVAALLSFFVALAAEAGPPLSRVEAVLDLSTPEAAVQTYADAFAANDFIAVYLALSPAARERFSIGVARLLLDDIVAADVDLDLELQLFAPAFGPFEPAAEQSSPIVSFDSFHVFEVALWNADQFGIHVIDLAGPPAVVSVGEPVDRDGTKEVVVETIDDREGPVRFVLQETPSGRWRIRTVIARPGADDEAVFLGVEARRP